MRYDQIDGAFPMPAWMKLEFCYSRSPSGLPSEDIFVHQKQLGNFKEGENVSFGVWPPGLRLLISIFFVGPQIFGHVHAAILFNNHFIIYLHISSYIIIYLIEHN